jgi:WD40 repeat protein
MLMNSRYRSLLLAVFALGIALLAGCGSGPHSETIIISGSGELERLQEASPVQVKKIYRLPDEYSNSGVWLGWSTSNSIVGSFKRGLSMGFMLERMTQPYEQSESMTQINTSSAGMILSPDGKYVSKTSMTHLATTLKILSLHDGTESEIATFKISDPKYLQDVSWSGNGKYLSFLVGDVSGSEKSMVGLYDIDSRTSQYYDLTNFDKGYTLLGAAVSDDGRGVLITSFQAKRNSIILGRLSDGQVEVKYERQIGRGQTAWIGNDQFAFLGADGALYEYDQRNNELSVILDRVSSFVFSHDRKYIAYTLLDEDVVYAGKMQGRNVLNNGPVYHGILPISMYWNGDNTRLLIQGSKAFADVQSGQNASDEGRSFVIEFE